MKLFNTLQELWDHCAFCPICLRKCREVLISVGPDDEFTLLSTKKSNEALHIKCSFKNKTDLYSIIYQINCLDNSYTVDIKYLCPRDSTADVIYQGQKILEPYFFFFIEGVCNECLCANSHSVDFELSILDKKISNLKLDREDFLLSSKKGSNSMLITLSYGKNILAVNMADNNSTPLPTIKLPMINLDFSDQDKAMDRIKTLILFS